MEESAQPTSTGHNFVRWVVRIISVATARILSVTDLIGQQLHISSKWASRAGFIVLWGIGMTFIQVDEYALALVSWAFSAVVLFSKAVHWHGPQGWPRATVVLRIVFVLGSIGLFPLSVVWTQAKRGGKPWSVLTNVRRTTSSSESKQQLSLPDGSQDAASLQVSQGPSKNDTKTQDIQDAAKARDSARERLNKIRKRLHEPAVTFDDKGDQVAKKELMLIVYPSRSLKEESFLLSSSINSFVVERLENSPPYVNDAEDSPVARSYEVESLDKYAQFFGRAVKDIHDKLKQHGLQDPALDELYQKPATTHGMRVVADRLQELAENLPDEPAPPPPSVVNNAPGGIINNGGVMTNPTVNNFRPPARHLTEDQQLQLREAVKATPTDVIVWAVGGDNEAWDFGADICKALKRAEWRVENGGVQAVIPGGPLYSDLAVFVNPEDGQLIAGSQIHLNNQAAYNLVTELRSLDFSVGVSVSDKVPKGSVKIVLGPPK